jgi:hypothetical protein
MSCIVKSRGGCLGIVKSRGECLALQRVMISVLHCKESWKVSYIVQSCADCLSVSGDVRRAVVGKHIQGEGVGIVHNALYVVLFL